MINVVNYLFIFSGIAWLVIPQTFRIEYGFFLFRSWNLFAIICSLPSIVFSCLLAKLPESPKFLLTKGKHDETINCLKYVYRWNNKTDDEFPVSLSLITNQWCFTGPLLTNIYNISLLYLYL